jgi:hypothetical protein
MVSVFEKIDRQRHRLLSFEFNLSDSLGGDGARAPGKPAAHRPTIVLRLGGLFLTLAALITAAVGGIQAPTPPTLGLLTGLFLTAVGSAAWADHQRKIVSSDLFLTLAALIFTAVIWQTCQIFDVAEDLRGGVLAAASAAFLLGLAGRSVGAGVVALVLVCISDFLRVALGNQGSVSGTMMSIILTVVIYRLLMGERGLWGEDTAHPPEAARINRLKILIFAHAALLAAVLMFFNTVDLREPQVPPPEVLIFKATLLATGAVWMRRGKDPVFSAMAFGWFAAGALGCLALVGLHPLGAVELIVHRLAWFGLAATTVVLAVKDRHAVAVGVGGAGLTGLACVLLFDLGLGWLGLAGALLAMAVLAVGISIALSTPPKASGEAS